MNMNPRQLIFVREYRGYSQTELSSHIVGLSQSNLSKFEKGIGSLSDEVKQKVIDLIAYKKVQSLRYLCFTGTTWNCNS